MKQAMKGVRDMKKESKYIIVFTIWTVLLLLFYNLGFITADFQKIKSWLSSDTEGAALIFILISFARIIVLLPNTVFFILGGICFGPILGFTLSMTAYIFTESVVYIVGRYFGGSMLKSYMNSRNKSVIKLLNKYGYEFLALGVLCPISPTDIICCAAAMLGYEYKKYILTAAIANMPMMLLYSFLGESFGSSLVYNLSLAIIILIIGNYTIVMWKRLKEESKGYDTV
jgi:uncharacterized membrane protein YdjX (TVP38/TMEM64 family)